MKRRYLVLNQNSYLNDTSNAYIWTVSKGKNNANFYMMYSMLIIYCAESLLSRVSIWSKFCIYFHYTGYYFRLFDVDGVDLVGLLVVVVTVGVRTVSESGILSANFMSFMTAKKSLTGRAKSSSDMPANPVSDTFFSTLSAASKL